MSHNSCRRHLLIPLLRTHHSDITSASSRRIQAYAHANVRGRRWGHGHDTTGRRLLSQSSTLNGTATSTSTTIAAANANARQEEVRRVAHERMAGRRRFYKVVDVRKVTEEEEGKDSVDSPISMGVDGTDSASGVISRPSVETEGNRQDAAVLSVDGLPKFTITLDGKRLRTPAGQNFVVPSEELAFAVAAEWDAQTEFITPAQMPLMTLACTAIDQTAYDKETTIQNILKYLPNDTTSYLVDPDEDRVLARKQKEHWDKLRVWSAKILGDEPAVIIGAVLIGKGGKLAHSKEVYEGAERFVRSLDIWSLTALQCATVEAKSFLVGLGLTKQYLSAEKAIGAARVEEEFQIGIWGCVEGQHDYDRLNCNIQMRSASFLLSCTQPWKKNFK